jgi:O-succinylbenzoate synthase
MAGRFVLVGAELVRVSLRLRQAWASGAGRFGVRDSLLVRAVIASGGAEVEGWGECGALPEPTYSAEYTEGAQEVCVRYLLPALFAAGVGRAEEVRAALGAVRGHKMAKTALEAAVLDAELRAAGCSLADHLAALSRCGMPRRDAVPAGAAVGLHSGAEALVAEVGRYVEAGYRRVKVKIAPGWDRAPVEALRSCWPGLELFADANGCYGEMPFADAVAVLRELEPLGLACLEQPLGEDDLPAHAELARRVAIPLCLDEALTSSAAVEAALDLGACSVVNLKPGRMGGYPEAVRAHDLCVERAVPAWCGGMVETGIARAANVALACLPGFSLTGDLAATGRFFETDLTSPLTLRADGTIAVPRGPGTGVEVDSRAVDAAATWRRWFPAAATVGPR